MKCVIILLILALNTYASSDQVLVPKERTAIFPQERAHLLITSVSYSPPEGITAFWTPAEEDLKGVESKLEAYLRVIDLKNHPTQIPKRSWGEFYRQVTGVVIGERRLLFLYYFYEGTAGDRARMEIERKIECERRGQVYVPESWKNFPHLVNDGGYLFFRLLFDPEKGAFVWYEENGDA